MQLITPPTDNIYKFLAVAGVVLFIASFVVPKQAEYILREKRFRKIAESAKAKADYEIWVGAEKRLEWEKKEFTDRREQLKEYMNRHPRAQLADDVAAKVMEQVLEVERRMMGFWRDHEKNAQLAGTADQGIGLIKSIDSETAFWEAEVNQMKWIFGTCFCLGIVMSVMGFISWWYKYQKPQDELTQLELKAKRLAAQKPF